MKKIAILDFDGTIADTRPVILTSSLFCAIT